MDAFIFQADIYCEDCGRALQIERKEYIGAEDSDAYPQGPYADGGGEADCPQHCGACRQFLDNALTGDGETYVRDAFREYVETGRGAIEVLADWKLAYDWCWDHFAEITFYDMCGDGEVTDAMQRRFDELEAI